MRRSVVLLFTLVLFACSEPPQKEIDRAQGAIDAARAAGAEQYATAEFAEATGALQQAHDAVEQRDYRLALSRALDASQRAQEAARQAADGRAAARSEAEAAVHASAAAVQQLETKLETLSGNRLPEAVLAPARQALTDGQRTVQEARAAIAAGQYTQARDGVKDTVANISAQIRALDEAPPAKPARRRR